MSRIHQSVVRNQGYIRYTVENIEKHNERKNKNYSNEDVILEQSINNIHFKVCDGTYLGEFDQMIKAGEISTKGLKLNSEGTKKESNIIEEMVFDLNTEYFDSLYESHGYESAYDFARAFYAETYKMAVKEVSDEKYILSAVLHADERNEGLSKELERDVYHYHLHVVYIPVTPTEILWTKRCKDPSLVCTVKEVINKVGHHGKWGCEMEVGEDGKKYLNMSYSKLQDRYHDHMKAAGFTGFERGKEGSTAKNLSAIEYKTKLREEELAEKEKALADTEKELEEKSVELAAADEELAALDRQLTQKENRVEKLSEKEKDIQGRIKSIEDSGQILTLKQIEKINGKVHAPVVGHRGIILTEDEYKNLKTTAMTAAKANEEIKKWKSVAKTANETIRDIVQAVSLIKYNFTEANHPLANNLTTEQKLLINSIRSHGEAIIKKYGYGKLVEDMKAAALDGAIAEIFSALLGEQRKKNQKNTLSFLEEATLKVRQENSKAATLPARKKDSCEL